MEFFLFAVILIGGILIMCLLMGELITLKTAKNLGFVWLFLLFWLVMAEQIPPVSETPTYHPIINVQVDGVTRSLYFADARKVVVLDDVYESDRYQVRRVYTPPQWRGGIYFISDENTKYTVGPKNK